MRSIKSGSPSKGAQALPVSLFAFIWAHSRRQQFLLLALTVLTFPFLYASLELPKRIINDAIGAEAPVIDVWGGHQVGQVDYLLLLCLAFLGAVLLGGMMKMRLNTMKGIVAERLLRRLRYTLISRMIRFPRPYFRTTSQGELVSMITSESEPMGGLMGDAVAQPVFQLGQMLTIVTFLFMQSVWFGLVSVALIPLQAWLIPMLQRQINLLNKDRIQEVRMLAAEIGETAAGIEDLRANGGWRYRMAQISDRLGRLFEIRRRIYTKKYFMKFLNNLIGHMTPFVFYSAGGVLAIRGEITVGALVAALAAYKDLSAPWKELLTYYNQVQDMSLRWKIMVDRFAPRGMIDAALIEGEPDEIPHLRGDIEMRGVSVRDGDGNIVLEDISLTIPAGSRVAIKSSSDSARAAFGQLLTREIMPARGTIEVAGHRFDQLHQGVIAARIGYAYSHPYLFSGSLGDNVLMPLRSRPGNVSRDNATLRKQAEAKRAGNSGDLLEADWVNPELAGLGSEGDLRDWWFQLIEAMGIDEQLFQRTLHARFESGAHPALVQHIIRLRPIIRERLQDAGLADAVHHFDPERFNPAVPLAGNILFAVPTREVPVEELIAPGGLLLRLIREQGLSAETMGIGLGVVDTLIKTFGREDTDHPLFLRLGIEEDLYRRLCSAAEQFTSQGSGGMSEEEQALLMTVPFLLSEEQIGSSLPDDFKARILKIRKSHAARLIAETEGLFQPLKEQAYFARLSVLENALFGRISLRAGARAAQVEAVVAEVLKSHGLQKRLALILYDLPTGLGGSMLEPVFQERAAFTRAAIKRPDILILDKALASHSAENRLRTRDRLRGLMPQTTMIFMEDHIQHPERYDLYFEIRDGRIDGVKRRSEGVPEGAGTSDFAAKFDIIAGADLFAQLDTRNQRLLAFSAGWHEVPAGERVFAAGESGDAVYLCLSGRAELRWPNAPEGAAPVSVIEPGRLIGDLAVITKDTRKLDLFAAEDCRFLRIGATEYKAVIESDINAALRLLETTAGHLSNAGDRMLSMAQQSAQGGVQDAAGNLGPEPNED